MEENREVTRKSGFRGTPNLKGRPKGIPNKTTVALKQMILNALESQGGQDYLARQADENPAAFLSLLGKILPTDIKAELTGTGSPMAFNVTVNIVDPKNPTPTKR